MKHSESGGNATTFDRRPSAAATEKKQTRAMGTLCALRRSPDAVGVSEL